MVIYAKFSDILGRKLLILVAVAFFTVFSIVCGSISNMIQLYVLLRIITGSYSISIVDAPVRSIVFRAFQGIGASGIFAMVTIIQPELVPPEHWGHIMAAVAVVTVVSSVLGPILGGLINDHGSWRWVFLLKLVNPPPFSPYDRDYCHSNSLADNKSRFACIAPPQASPPPP